MSKCSKKLVADMGLHNEKRGVENKAFEDTESSNSHANAETPKTDAAKAESTKEEVANVELAKAESAKAEAAKAESAMVESTKEEAAANVQSAKAESAKAEMAKAASTKVDAAMALAEAAPAEKKSSLVSAKDVEAAKGAEQARGGCGRGLTTNVVVLSVAYLLLFTAFKGAANLQSSVNAEGGRGTSALMAYYAAFIASSIFLPAVMIRKLGCKWTMALCAVAYAPFMAANLHAEFYTLVPGALVAGAGAGPAWCALSTYTSLAGERRARAAGHADVEAATARLYSLFYTVYQLNQVSGNLVSSLVLSAGLDEPIPVPMPAANETLESATAAALEAAVLNATWSAAGSGAGPGTCGASLCGDIAADAPHPPPPAARLNWLCVVYLACVLMAAAMLAFGVQELSRKGAEGAEQPSALELLAATMKLLRRRRLLLLVPVFFFFGAEKAFVGAEFTAGYVSCVSGVASIGYVMICYGLTNSGASAAAGWLNARAGRRRLMAATVALHAALLAVLLAWEPRAAAASSRAVLFPLAALWGVVDGLWLVQINTLVSHLFPGDEEAAFSNYHLWESAGYIAAYGYSAHLCVYVKLYILAALLAGGTLTFAAIELLLVRSKRRVKALGKHDA